MALKLNCISIIVRPSQPPHPPTTFNNCTDKSCLHHHHHLNKIITCSNNNINNILWALKSSRLLMATSCQMVCKSSQLNCPMAALPWSCPNNNLPSPLNRQYWIMVIHPCWCPFPHVPPLPVRLLRIALNPPMNTRRLMLIPQHLWCILPHPARLILTKPWTTNPRLYIMPLPTSKCNNLYPWLPRNKSKKRNPSGVLGEAGAVREKRSHAVIYRLKSSFVSEKRTQTSKLKWWLRARQLTAPQSHLRRMKRRGKPRT